jgi:hypothetical protein
MPNLHSVRKQRKCRSSLLNTNVVPLSGLPGQSMLSTRSSVSCVTSVLEVGSLPPATRALTNWHRSAWSSKGVRTLFPSTSTNLTYIALPLVHPVDGLQLAEPVVVGRERAVRVPNSRKPVLALFYTLLRFRRRHSRVTRAVQFTVVDYVLSQFSNQGVFVTHCVAVPNGCQ